MAKKNAETIEAKENTESAAETTDEKIEQLNRMLAAVLNYLSDDEVEVIDIEYLLKTTEGLREWWDSYREQNRKTIEKEIKSALGNLPLEELEKIYEQVIKKEANE